MSFGKIIRKRREEMGLTQDALARQAGISKPYLSNIETGRTRNPPSDGVLRELELRLGFNPGDLTHLAHLARTPIDVLEQHELLEAEVQKLRSVVRALLAAQSRHDVGADNFGGAAAKLIGDGAGRRIAAGVAVPVINTAASGYPQRFPDLNYPSRVAEEYIRCPDLHDPQAFAARVVGDSMEPRYRQDDIVIFSPAKAAETASDCFVRFGADRGTTFKRIYLDAAETVRLQPLNSMYPAETYSRAEVTGLWPAVYRIERIADS